MSELQRESKSIEMQTFLARLERVARTRLDVLIQGETGTGKEVVARAIHDRSPRGSGPYVVVDCAALPPTLAEALLFGHEPGIFTGANGARPSPFVLADGGTLLLDEIGELPRELQPKLLRVLAERAVQPLGARAPRRFDVRILAATNRELGAEVAAGRFRADLFHRLGDHVLAVPPLRHRRDDIPALIRQELTRLGDEAACDRIPAAAWTRVIEHDWPGNVRELFAAVRSAWALAGPGEPIEPTPRAVVSCTGPEPAGEETFHAAKERALDRFARTYFTALAGRVGGNVSAMSRAAGLDRKCLREYLVRLGIARGVTGCSGGSPSGVRAS